MIILDFPQQSPEWFAARCGIPSASCFDKIVTAKGEPSKQAQSYLYQLAGERITGAKVETYQNAAMQRGNELEAEARQLFSMVRDVEVRQVGICYFDERKSFSCSPDGLMEREGLEIKCPLIHTHVGYLLEGALPMDYFQQVQGSMLVTGFPAWSFMSYYPGLPPLIIRVERDNAFCARLKVALDEFCSRLDEVEKKLRELI
jgi:hypothetical protein